MAEFVSKLHFEINTTAITDSMKVHNNKLYTNIYIFSQRKMWHNDDYDRGKINSPGGLLISNITRGRSPSIISHPVSDIRASKPPSV